MKLQTKILFGAVILVSALIGAFIALRQADPMARALRSGKTVIVQAEGSYGEVTFDQMIDQADLIVLGQVIAISDPFWNQDSGEYWEPVGDETRMPIHTVTIKVSQFLFGSSDSDQIVVTVTGNSPSGSAIKDATGAEIVIGGGAAHNLQVGQSGVFFVTYKELAWRGGTKSVLRFMGDPGYSYLLQGEDGLYHHGAPEGKVLSLDDLVKLINEHRK